MQEFEIGIRAGNECEKILQKVFRHSSSKHLYATNKYLVRHLPKDTIFFFKTALIPFFLSNLFVFFFSYDGEKCPEFLSMLSTRILQMWCTVIRPPKKPQKKALEYSFNPCSLPEGPPCNPVNLTL